MELRVRLSVLNFWLITDVLMMGALPNSHDVMVVPLGKTSVKLKKRAFVPRGMS